MWYEKKSPSANVELGASVVRLGIEDARKETRDLFERLSSDERRALVVEAWKLGLRAVSEEREDVAESTGKPACLSGIPPGCW
ncbi:MAG: hypothetical protein WBN01_11610 [Polyangiales bacterium]